MKKNISLAIFGIFLLFLVSASLVSASVDAVVNYKPTASSKIVSKGDSFDVALVGIGNGEKLNLEKLELRGPNNYLVLEEYASGTDNSGYGIYTYGRQLTINTANYNYGTYKIRFTTRGAQTGNIDYDEIDLIINSPPAVSILTPANNVQYANFQDRVKFNVGDVNGNLDKCWATDGTTTTPKITCIGGGVTTIVGLNSNVGSNTWTVYAQDTMGDITSASTTFIVQTDSTAPVITILTPVNGNTYFALQNTITYTAVDAKGNLNQCWATNGVTTTSKTSCTGSITLSSVAGSNTWTVYADDLFGNIGSATTTFTVSIDTTAPTITISTPINGNYYNAPVTQIDFTPVDADGNLFTCWYSLDNGATISTKVGCVDSVSNSFTSGIISKEGLNNWIVYAEDFFGNIGSTSFSFTRDTIAPAITALDPMDNDELTNEDVILAVSTSEAVTLQYSLDGGAKITMTETSLGSLIFESANLNLDYDESYSVTYYATDLAGNTASLTITFDINEDDDGNSNYDGDSFYQTQFTNQYNPLNPSIDLTDDEPAKLNWWQRFINWLCRLFGLEEIY